MASTKLRGVFSVLLMLMGICVSETTDLFPAPRPIRENGLRRQMMLVPTFVQQAASPTMFFVGGNERPRQQHFRHMSSEAASSSEERLVRPPNFGHDMRSSLTRVTTPPRSEQMGRIVHHRPNEIRQQRPFDIRTAAASPERPSSFNRPVPPTFFIEDGLPFPPMFELPPSRHFQQTNLRQSPPRTRPPTTPRPTTPAFEMPQRHFEQTELRPFRPPSPQTRPTTTRPTPTAFEVPPRHFEQTELRQFGPPSPQMRPATESPTFEEPPRHPQQNNVQQFRPPPPQKRPTTEFRPPPPQKRPTTEFRPPAPQKRPTTTESTFEEPPRHFEQTELRQFRPPPPQRRPTTTESTFEEPPRHFEQQFRPPSPPPRPTTAPTRPTSLPQRRPANEAPQAATRILPSVLDSLQGSDVSVFIPGEAGRDYPLFSDAPRTRFACRKEMVSNFVADVETQCQVVRVCREDGEVDNFLCPNGTLFDNDSQFCNWWYRVPCGDNADSNQIPHRGRTVPQAERENRFRQRPETESRPRPQRPQRPQRPSSDNVERERDEGKTDHELDGFFSRPVSPKEENFAVGGIPRTRFEFESTTKPQPQETFFEGNLDDFFGHPRLVVEEHRAPSPQTTRETTQLPITTAVVPSTLIITTRPHKRTKPTRKQRTRKPFPTRAPTTVGRENFENIRVDQSDVGTIGGFGLAEEEEEVEKLTTRRPIATVRNRGRATFKPQQIVETEPEFPATTLSNLKGEFDPFFDEQSHDLETTTTTRRKPNTRRTTTTAKPTSSSRKPTRKTKTKLTPSTTRFRNRSTKRPRVKPTTRPITTTTTTTTTEKPIVAEVSGDNFSVTTFVSETERPIPRKIAKFSDGNLEMEHFTHDPLFSAEPEIRTSPFSIAPRIKVIASSTPVNFDPFYFGPAVTRDFPGPVSLDELPVAGVLPEDTVSPVREDATTPKIQVETSSPKLRTSKRRGKSSRKNRVSTSTTTTDASVDVEKEKVSSSTPKTRSKSRSRSRSRSRSKSRSRKSTTTTAAPSSGDAPSSTERIFATPRSRAQLFPTRQSLMKKTKQAESSTSASELAEEAQESNTITVAETTIPTITTTDNVTVT